MACYDTIIGLARTDCPCIPETPNTGFNTSDSGLYITDVPPFDSLTAFDDCGNGGVWDMLQKSKDEAISTFIADTNSLLMRTFKSRRERFKGQIGEATGRDVFESQSTYAGIRIACNPLRGGRIKITHIGTLFHASGTLDIQVYNSLNQLILTKTVDILNGWKLTELTTPIVLPTYIDFDWRHEYFLVYTYNPSNKPRINNINCGCGGFIPWYDQNKPIWAEQQHPASRAWANWCMVGGWTGSTLTDFDRSPISTYTQMNGLAIQIELGCDVGQVLCNGALDYTTDPFALSQAYSIRYKACEILASKLLASTDLNRQNLVNRDTLQGLKRDWNASYVENVNYITQEAQLRQNDCLACRDDYNFAIKTMLS